MDGAYFQNASADPEDIELDEEIATLRSQGKSNQL